LDARLILLGKILYFFIQVLYCPPFLGHRLDVSDGLIYMRARYYVPAMGRFITSDTIIASPYNPQTLNRYAYCDNNPINFIDPLGNWKLRNFLKSTVQVTAIVAAVAMGPGAGFMAYAALGGITAAATTALTSGANLGDVMKAGAIGFAAGGVAGAVASGVTGAVGSGSSSLFGAGVGEFMSAVAGGAAGGYAAGFTAAELYGGSFSESNRIGTKGALIGGAMAGAGKLFEYAYTGMRGGPPDPRPGAKLANGTYDVDANPYHQPPFEKNVFGLHKQLTGNFWQDFGTQGGALSKFANQIPGMNAVAALHDAWMNNVTFTLTNNLATMPHAVAFTYIPLLGSASTALINQKMVEESKYK
jgi:RHS repeat-associated protein